MPITEETKMAAEFTGHAFKPDQKVDGFWDIIKCVTDPNDPEYTEAKKARPAFDGDNNNVLYTIQTGPVYLVRTKKGEVIPACECELGF
jgi:hypothetical protein